MMILYTVDEEESTRYVFYVQHKMYRFVLLENFYSV
jgi:hypothetical protein